MTSLANFFILAAYLLFLIDSVNSTFSRNPDDVKFYFYKDRNVTDAAKEIPFRNKEAFKTCGYDETKPVIVLMHGTFSNFLTRHDIRIVKDAYLAADIDANIIVVDYGKLFTPAPRIPRVFSPFGYVLFVASVYNTNRAARRIADFLLFAMEAKVLKGPGDIHLIGFSIGAHVAGTVGRHISRKVSKPVRRITGLDPSPQVPLPSLLLDQSDAEFVDVTFTSFGYLTFAHPRIGHAKFFLNGGITQPNCPNLFPVADPFCSHLTATHYFADSIKNKNIVSCKCKRCRTPRRQPKRCSTNNLTNYGHWVSESTRGDFFVRIS